MAVDQFLRGSKNGEIAVLLPKKTFNAIVSGEQKSGWLELKNVYWAQNSKHVPQEIAGKPWGYGKDCFIKIEDINRIVPLSEEAIQSLPNR